MRRMARIENGYGKMRGCERGKWQVINCEVKVQWVLPVLVTVTNFDRCCCCLVLYCPTRTRFHLGTIRYKLLTYLLILVPKL